MKEQSGAEYQSTQFAKAMFIDVAKAGKTCFLTASALGVLPWQKNGGIVDKPENLHVVTFDANAFGGVQRFIKETCKAPPEALKLRVYNMQDDFRSIYASEVEYDSAFYNKVFATLDLITERASKGGVHAIIISSLTGLAAGIERGITGPPGKSKGYSDPSKWKQLAAQLTQLQNFVQQDQWHTFWEAHLDKGSQFNMGKGEDSAGGPKETIHVSGQAGRSWGYNCEQVFKIRRNFGTKHPGTECDVVVIDTRPSLEYVVGGRNFNEALKATEPDMTLAFHKLGLKIGRWGSKSK